MVEESARIARAPATITVASISVVDDLSDFPESGAADSQNNVATEILALGLLTNVRLFRVIGRLLLAFSGAKASSLPALSLLRRPERRRQIEAQIRLSATHFRRKRWC